MMANLVKHICVYCKSVQYIPTRLRNLISKMYCYVCGKSIEETEAEIPKYLSGKNKETDDV
jgi:hypothetical protein